MAGSPERLETQTPQQQLTEALEWWDDFLSIIEPEQFEYYATQAVIELNSLWPYNGQECYFSGQGVYTRYAPHTDDMSPKERALRAPLEFVEGEVPELRGFSGGFAFTNWDQNERPALRYAFHLGRLRQDGFPLLKSWHEPMAYLDIKGAQILPLSEVEDALQPPAVEGGYEHLEETVFDDAAYLRSVLRSTKFRRMAWDRQKKTVDDHIRWMERRYDIGKLFAYASAEYCWKLVTTANGSMYMDRLWLGAEILQGACRGFSSPERLNLDYRAIRNDRNMIDAKAGACLLLEIMGVTDGLGEILKVGDIVHLPLSEQELNVSFTIPQDENEMASA